MYITCAAFSSLFKPNEMTFFFLTKLRKMTVPKDIMELVSMPRDVAAKLAVRTA